MTNERLKNITFVSCAIGWIGGSVCVIKEAVEKELNVKWRDLAKTFGRGFAVGAALGCTSELINGRRREQDKGGNK